MMVMMIVMTKTMMMMMTMMKEEALGEVAIETDGLAAFDDESLFRYFL